MFIARNNNNNNSNNNNNNYYYYNNRRNLEACDVGYHDLVRLPGGEGQLARA